jgi:hypothetical protein
MKGEEVQHRVCAAVVRCAPRDALTIIWRGLMVKLTGCTMTFSCTSCSTAARHRTTSFRREGGGGGGGVSTHMYAPREGRVVQWVTDSNGKATGTRTLY